MALILNNLLPIFVVICLGIFLKHWGWLGDSFISSTDRLIYYIFFPCLLFWKISKPVDDFGIEPELVFGVFLTVFMIFSMSILFCKLTGMAQYEIGSFSQGCYRFSSYIGLALTFSAFGDAGGRTFGVLIGFVIPFINVLVVSSMIWYSGESGSGISRMRLVVKAMISNPLILACLGGILYSRMSVPLPTFIDNTLGLMSSLTLPLALVSIGGTLSFSGSRKFLAKSFQLSIIKLVAMPVLGYITLKQLEVTPLAIQVAMVYFALPTSPQNYILSSQLNSDVDLATSSILVTTTLSILSLSVVLIVFG